MPTIAVDKARLYEALGKQYTTREFEQLCFDYGLELDEDTTESCTGNERPELKIEIPANRYDMLCFEGIALNLQVFLGLRKMPHITATEVEQAHRLTVNVHQDTAKIRPYFSAAILRNVKLDQARYDSFIALQDKLHANLARNRTLVAIGTHDLDTIEGPFSYEALPPPQINFAPLNKTKPMRADEIMTTFEQDKHLSKFLHIIRNEDPDKRHNDIYPIIYDKNRQVLSMPPIINSNHSKISPDTKNVFIDITATDKTKVEIVNHILVAMFSAYCTEPFTVEQVNIVSPHNGESRLTPSLAPTPFKVSTQYINSTLGLHLSRDEWSEKLAKMCHNVAPSQTNTDELDVDVPITRADVLHPCDIMEDAGVAYGFNKLPREDLPAHKLQAAPLPIEKLSGHVRAVAACTWIEVMPLTLCSKEENYDWLNHPFATEGQNAVQLENPKTAEYQIVRTSLVPGLLKTFRENRQHALPLKIFEVYDVCYKDDTLERRSRNERHLGAAYYGLTSGFEEVHGLVDRVMAMLRVVRTTATAIPNNDDHPHAPAYYLKGIEDPTYLPARVGGIFLRVKGRDDEQIGIIGTVRPDVGRNFNLKYPVSVAEINLEPFL